MTSIRLINDSFQLFGSALSIILILCLLITHRYRERSEKLYLLMLSSNLCAMVFDMLALYFRGKPGGVAWFMVRGTNYGQFFCSNIMSFTFMAYLKTYLEDFLQEKVSRRYYRVGFGMLLLGTALLTVNLVHPIIYEITEENLYQRLPLYPLLYVPMMLSALAAGHMLYSKHRKLRREMTFSFALYLLIPFVSIVITALVYGIVLGYIGTTLVLISLFLYSQLEQSERMAELYAKQEIYRVKEVENAVNYCIRASMTTTDPEDNIRLLLQNLGEKLRLERIWLTEKGEDGSEKLSYDWAAEKDTHGTEAEKRSPSEGEGQSICVPILSGNEELGALHLAWRTGGHQVSKEILEIISSFLQTLLNRRETLKELKRLSLTDSGTGAGNRYAMYRHFRWLKDQERVGVVYCDITGLKRVNDEEGHAAGDILIKNTYEALHTGFRAADIFRIGGDEFVILSCGLSYQEFEERVERIRRACSEKGVTAAIGSEHLPRAMETVEQTLAEAEMRMYREKNAWYESRGLSKRRGSV